jgi:hypothetical protein
VTALVALYATAALAGELIVDAKVPVEVHVDAVVVAQLFYPSQVKLDAKTGKRTVKLMINGKANTVLVDVPAEGAAHISVGRSGVTVDAPETAADATPTVPVEFRVIGNEPLVVQLGTSRHPVDGGGRLALDLDTGLHQMVVRSTDGTAIWARGKLDLLGTGPVVVHVSEGRMPEITGDTGTFRPTRQ